MAHLMFFKVLVLVKDELYHCDSYRCTIHTYSSIVSRRRYLVLLWFKAFLYPLVSTIDKPKHHELKGAVFFIPSQT